MSFYSSHRHRVGAGAAAKVSTSTSISPPSTPTIRITSPVLSAAAVVDLWNPVEPPPTAAQVAEVAEVAKVAEVAEVARSGRSSASSPVDNRGSAPDQEPPQQQQHPRPDAASEASLVSDDSESNQSSAVTPIPTVSDHRGHATAQSFSSRTGVEDVVLGDRDPTQSGHPDAAGSMGHKEEQSVGATSPSVHDRLSMLKEDAHLMEAATDFVNRLLRLAQDEARQHDLADKLEQKTKMSLDLKGAANARSAARRRPWYRRLRFLLLRTLAYTCVPSGAGLQSPLSA